MLRLFIIFLCFCAMFPYGYICSQNSDIPSQAAAREAVRIGMLSHGAQFSTNVLLKEAQPGHLLEGTSLAEGWCIVDDSQLRANRNISRVDRIDGFAYDHKAERVLRIDISIAPAATRDHWKAIARLELLGNDKSGTAFAPCGFEIETEAGLVIAYFPSKKDFVMEDIQGRMLGQACKLRLVFRIPKPITIVALLSPSTQCAIDLLDPSSSK